MWRRRDREKDGDLTSVEPDLSVTIAAETHFQFKNAGDSDLVVLIVTSPIWPGEHEAQDVEAYWYHFLCTVDLNFTTSHYAAKLVLDNSASSDLPGFVNGKQNVNVYQNCFDNYSLYSKSYTNFTHEQRKT